MIKNNLSGKYKEYAKGLWVNLNTKERLTQEATEIFDDIKLAILWLRKEINKEKNWLDIENNVGQVGIEKNTLLDLINEAFKDVIKK